MENYRGLYKVPSKAVSLGESKRGDKRENALREQKRKREDTFFRKRNIPEDSASPAAPAPKKTANETRRDKLLKWKLEKDRIVAQLKLIEKKKPPFKVGVAHHTLDPTKEFAPPVRATAVKCTTAKKAAAETRTDAAEKRKAHPRSVAAASLASLSAASSQLSSAFSGRVTRSRTAAAAAASKAPPPPETAPTVKAKTKPLAPSVSSRKPGSAASSRKGKERKEPEKSFAPKDHKFKAPASLTFPTTPITLKRNRAAAFKEANWPVIPGVNLLEDSPAAPSPASTLKSGKRTASLGRARLSRSVKQQTPKERKTKEVEIVKSTKSPFSNQRKRLIAVDDTPEQVDAPEEMMEMEIATELPKPVKSRKSVSKTRRMSRKSGGEDFIVTEISTVAVTQEQEVEKSSLSAFTDEPLSSSKLNAGETPLKKFTNVDGDKSEDRPTTGNYSRKSKKNSLKLKEKENVPADIFEPFQAETMSLSFSEIDPIDTITADSRRMSIHDPSPPINITPDKLSMGMVPAQFSPYVTSARGKDKYSLQKRRNSLIPVVPDVSAEELAKSNQVEHFRNLLERESSRLLTVSKLWEERKDEAPSHAQDGILGAIGQARLLVKDKFQQFKRLVDKFEVGESEGMITSDDLTGFWEMMLLTVENVDKRFKELEDLKANDWHEQIAIVPVKKPVVPAVPKPVKAAAAPSRLKSVIEAMRKRKQERKQNLSVNKSSDVATFDGGFFKVESPRKILPSPRALSKPSPSVTSKGNSTPVHFQRRSLLQHVLTNSAVRAHKSPNLAALNKSLPLSPSPKVVVAQMRASEIGRRMSMDSGNDSYSSAPPSPVTKVEPTKSILKSAGVRRSLRVNTPRNRVAFHVLSGNSAGSPTLPSPEGTPPTSIGTPSATRVVTPGGRRRASLIPRPISTPGQSDRPSLLPMRESLVSTKPLEGGDLIDWSSPKSDSKPSRRSRQSNVR